MKGCVITVDGQECYRFDNTPVSRDTNVTCASGVLNGSVVRVSGGDQTINMCEFEVISCSDDYWGSGCDRRCGNCSNGEVCDKVTGHCSSCPPGLQPPLCDTGTHGRNCTEPCSEGCEDVCDKVSGHCTCKPGWLGPTCDAECPPRTYGLNCMQNCSVHCNNTCDKATGHCTCNRGYIPPLCLTEIPSEKMEAQFTLIGGAVGGSVVVLVVIIIIVVIVVRCLRSRSRRNKGGSADNAASYGAGRDSAQILSSTNQRIPVTQSENVYEAVEGEVNDGYVNSKQTMPATTQYQTERSPVPMEGESRREPARESSVPSADQPYEIVDRDRENTYEKPQLYVNTGEHHVYSDLQA